MVKLRQKKRGERVGKETGMRFLIERVNFSIVARAVAEARSVIRACSVPVDCWLFLPVICLHCRSSLRRVLRKTDRAARLRTESAAPVPRPRAPPQLGDVQKRTYLARYATFG